MRVTDRQFFLVCLSVCCFLEKLSKTNPNAQILQVREFTPPEAVAGRMSATLLEAVRALRVAFPDLGQKPLLAKLRGQQPDLGAGAKEVREALAALKAEGEAKVKAAAAAATAAATVAAAAPPAADEDRAPLPVALSLACIGCFRLPSDMDDDREKHPICDMCRDEKLPTTYLCGVNCPANPGAWKIHGKFHKALKRQNKRWEDGGTTQQQHREAAERQARLAAQTSNTYLGLIAEGLRYTSKEDYRRAARIYREAIALQPDEPAAYYNLGGALHTSGHLVEAAQRFLEAKERWPVGSENWGKATNAAFEALMLLHTEYTGCGEATKPEWWNDEGLKALSARVVRAAPNDLEAIQMRALVLSGRVVAATPRSAAELMEAATHYERCAALCDAPALKDALAGDAACCRRRAEARQTT